MWSILCNVACTDNQSNMVDFMKSAFGGIIGGGQSEGGNDFVGQFVELGNQKLRVKKEIAEGKKTNCYYYCKM